MRCSVDNGLVWLQSTFTAFFKTLYSLFVLFALKAIQSNDQTHLFNVPFLSIDIKLFFVFV